MANPSDFLATSGRLDGASPTAAPAASLGVGGMSKPQDPSELLYQGENVLGKDTSVSTPGQVSQPLTAGIASTPTAGGITTDPGGAVNRPEGLGSGGFGGRGFGSGEGSGGLNDFEGSGQSLESLIAQILGAGTKTAEFLSRFNKPEDLGSRGDTGGTSLSDQLRSFLSAGTGAATGAGAAAGGFGGGMGSLGTGAGSATAALPAANISPDYINAVDALFKSGLGGEQIESLIGSVGSPDFGGLEQMLSGSQGTAAGAAGGAGGAGGAGALGTGAGAAGNIASSVGTGALGTGAISALMGIIASQLGNRDLGLAAQGLGIGSGLTGLGATAAQGASVAPAAGALAPIAGPMLFASIVNMLGGGMNLADMFTGGEPDPWVTYGKRLGQTLGLESESLQRVHDALPYVQSQEELGQLLNTFRNRVGSRVGGYGAGQDLYTIPDLPGATGTAHEWGQMADYGGPVNFMNQVIQAYTPFLPGQRINDPNAVLGGADQMRLWTQFGDRSQEFPQYLPTDQPAQVLGFGEIPGARAGYYPYNPQTGLGAMQGALTYGMPGYNYAGAGLPAPGQYLGSMSQAWQALTNPANFQAPPQAPPAPAPQAQAPAPAPAPAPPAPAGPATLSPETIQALMAGMPAEPVAKTPGAPGAAGEQIDEIIKKAAARQ